MTVNTGRLGEAINNLRAFGATSDHERQEYVSLIVVAAPQVEILFRKFACQRYMTNHTDGSCLVDYAEVELWAAVVCPW